MSCRVKNCVPASLADFHCSNSSVIMVINASERGKYRYDGFARCISRYSLERGCANAGLFSQVKSKTTPLPPTQLYTLSL